MSKIVKIGKDIKNVLRETDSTAAKLVIIYRAICCFLIIFPLIYVVSLIMGILLLANPLEVADEILSSLF